MVQPEKADSNLISRTLSSFKSITGSSGGDEEALPSSPSKSGNAKLISYSVTPKPAPAPLPLPRPIRAVLQTCCGSNMKWVSFPVCCAFTFGLFLAFTRASSLVQYSQRGFSSYINSRQLSHKDPQQMPDAADALFGGGGGDGAFQHRVFAPAPACDCSKCLEREDIYNPGNPQYRTLIKHGLQHFYGHQDIALRMSAFVPFKKKQWKLQFALYTTANSICSDKPGVGMPETEDTEKILAVVLVVSAPGNVELRQAIRRTWGSKDWPRAPIVSKSRLVFVIGSSDEQRYNDIMLQESRTYDDVILADVSNDKDSRTKKVLSGFKWVDMYCPNAQHVIKADDHMFLDLPRILDLLSAQDLSNMIYGSIAYAKKAHDKAGDTASLFNSIREQHYPLKWYPPHAVGTTFYIVPTQLTKRMISTSENVPYNPKDDVFITGILAKVFDARHINIPPNLLDDKKHPISLCNVANKYKIAENNFSPEMADKVWKRIHHPEMCGS